MNKIVKNMVMAAGTLVVLAALCIVHFNTNATKAVDPEPVIPEYSGSPSVVLNDNKPQFSSGEITSVSFESYGELDELGRCTAAVAGIGKDLMPTKDRESISMVKPSGWNQEKYPGLIDSDPPYLYNRCHMIGFQLTGENANEKNLITGTRYFNVEGMLPYENQVADYIRDTGNHVMYWVTPVFQGDNLLCDGVKIEAYSVEDSGKGVSFNVFCYNVQPGVIIDYFNGENRPDKGYKKSQNQAEGTTFSADQFAITGGTDNSEGDRGVREDADNSKAKATDSLEEPSGTTHTYVGNSNSHVFHYSSCGSVSDMKEKNKVYFDEGITRDEVMERGFRPCQRCKP